MKNNKGVTLAVLVITIIVLAIISTITINIGIDIVKEKNLKSIVTNMLLIQSRVNIIKEKHTVSETNELVGTEVNEEVAKNFNQTGTWYKWENEDVQSEGINVTLKDGAFYLVNYETGEVIYSKGYTVDDTTYYTLTDLKKLDKNEMSVDE